MATSNEFEFFPEWSVEDAVTEVLKRQGPCIFCGGPSTTVSAFTPESPAYREAVGAPPNKTRILLYPCCQSCQDKCATDPVAFEPMIIETFRRFKTAPPPPLVCPIGSGDEIN